MLQFLLNWSKSRVEPSDNIHNTETKDYLLSLSNENGSGNQQALDNGIDDYIINNNTTMKDDDHNTVTSFLI